jgi:hypothetical protein
MDTTIIDIEIVPVVEARLSRLISWLKNGADERYTQVEIDSIIAGLKELTDALRCILDPDGPDEFIAALQWLMRLKSAIDAPRHCEGVTTGR